LCLRSGESPGRFVMARQRTGSSNQKTGPGAGPCDERKPAFCLRAESSAIGGWFPSLSLALPCSATLCFPPKPSRRFRTTSQQCRRNCAESLRPSKRYGTLRKRTAQFLRTTAGSCSPAAVVISARKRWTTLPGWPGATPNSSGSSDHLAVGWLVYAWAAIWLAFVILCVRARWEGRG
jgi:hypothetical protein